MFNTSLPLLVTSTVLVSVLDPSLLSVTSKINSFGRATILPPTLAGIAARKRVKRATPSLSLSYSDIYIFPVFGSSTASKGSSKPPRPGILLYASAISPLALGFITKRSSCPLKRTTIKRPFNLPLKASLLYSIVPLGDLFFPKS